MVSPPLQEFTIAVTGNFGEARTTSKMKQWIKVNGGKYAWEMSSKVMYLICSKEHFKKNVNMVRQARKLGVMIVSFDWLEDSLMKMVPQKIAQYLMVPRVKAAAETKAKKKTIRKKNIAKGMEVFEKSCKESEEQMHTNGYGIYRDSTTFAYDITLARANLLTNKNERWVLQLYVTHATPKYYATYVKYSAPGTEPKGELIVPIGSTWETAWDMFQSFFKLKTRKDWDGRFIKGIGGSSDVGQGAQEAPFVYSPPKEGVPRGVFLEI